MAALAMGRHRQENRKDGCVTLIDTEVAALILNVTPRRVRQLITEGKLTNHGEPRRIRLDLDQVTRHATPPTD